MAKTKGHTYTTTFQVLTALKKNKIQANDTESCFIYWAD